MEKIKQKVNKIQERTFKTSSKEDIENILEQKDPVNTKKSMKLWMNCFRQYLSAKSKPSPEDILSDELPETLQLFYAEVQKKGKKTDRQNISDDEKIAFDEVEGYKNTTMRTIRAAIARFYHETRSLDIISNENFIRANAIFTGIQKINNKKGLGTINRKTPINEHDISQLIEYFRVSIIADLNPRNLQNICIFNILYYMCRRGRENLRLMKQYTYAVTFDNEAQRKYIYQAVDEYDKNHNETDTSIANEGHMYEIPGTTLSP